MAFFTKSKLEKIDDFIKKKRETHDMRYNPYELLDFLTSDEVDVLMSISNRTDGKTYTYILVLLWLCNEFGLTFVLLSRHFMLRKAYLSTLTEIMTEQKTHDMNKVTFINHDDFVEVIGKNHKRICSVTDLNSATDLKYQAQKLRHYDLIVYDEFIALEHEYLSYEVDSMQIIYETMDRESDQRILPNQKILMMGNAMNFSSPFISYWDLFRDIEEQDINTMRVYERPTQDGDMLKIAVELRRNESVNKTKNNRIFNMGGNNYAMSGEFTTNRFLLSDDKFDLFDFYVIKYDDKYIKVYYTETKLVLSILHYSERYHYCNKICDVKEGVRFMTDKDYTPKMLKHMVNGSIKYANTFSLRYISDNLDLCTIRYKSIAVYLMYKPSHNKEMVKEQTRRERQLAFLAKFYEAI